MGFGTSCCKTYINILNTLFGLVGAGILAIAIYVLVEGNNIFGFDGSAIGLPSWWGWIPFGIGIVIIFMSFIACSCTKEGNICLIFTVGFTQFVFGVLLILSGASLIYYTNTVLANVANTPYTQLTYSIAPGFYGVEQSSADFSVGLFIGCCQQATLKSCSSVSNVGPCYSNEEAYAAGNSSAYLSDQLNSQFCEDVSPNNAGCGALGSTDYSGMNTWLSNLQSYAKKNAFPSGIALCVFGGLLVLAFMGTCVVGCKRHRSKRLPQQSQQQQPSYQQGTTLVYS
jgi:hypothetical protein